MRTRVDKDNGAASPNQAAGPASPAVRTLRPGGRPKGRKDGGLHVVGKVQAGDDGETGRHMQGGRLVAGGWKW